MVKREISRMNDYFARFLLGRRESESMLLNFVNAVMRDCSLPEFATVAVRNPYNLKERCTERETIVDVKATTNTGETVLIEVQVQGNNAFFGRVLEYWAKNYRTEQLVSSDGEKIKRLSPVISINLLAFTLFPNIEYAHTSHMIHCCQTKEITSDKMQIHFLELSKAYKFVKEQELQTWIQYFGSTDFENEKETIASKGEIFMRAVKDYEHFRNDTDLISEYEKREIFLSGQAAMLDYERQESRAEGHAEGHAEGRTEGLEQGKAEGLKEGFHSGQIETAKKALMKGLSTSDISDITGLSKEEILLLK